VADIVLCGDINFTIAEAAAIVAGYACATQDVVDSRRRPPAGLAQEAVATKPAFAYSFYDGVPRRPSPGHEVLAESVDVLVANGLNARMKGRDIAQVVGALPAVNEHLRRIPEGFQFQDADREGLGSPDAGDATTKAMWSAWWQLNRLSGVDSARTNKLLHRVRPHVFPLYDRKTKPLLGSNPWQTTFDDLQRNSPALVGIQDAVAPILEAQNLPQPTALRIHDILLWTCAAEHRNWALEQGQQLLTQR
jgi:hypothetical protein